MRDAIEIRRVKRTAAPRGSTNVRIAASSTTSTTTTPATATAIRTAIIETPDSLGVPRRSPRPLDVGSVTLLVEPALLRGAGRPRRVARRLDVQRVGEPFPHPVERERAVARLGTLVGRDDPH